MKQDFRKLLRGLTILLLSLSLVSIAGCLSNSSAAKVVPMKPGTYSVTKQGFEHEFNIDVTVDENSILSIDVKSHHESRGVGERALPIVVYNILKNQSVVVDGLSGATVTSAALRAAVRDGLTQAGATSEMFAEDKRTPVPPNGYTDDYEPDVIVVGGGLAGLYASLAVAKNGGKSLLLEQFNTFGGSSMYSGGAYAHAGSQFKETNYPNLSGTPASFADFIKSANARNPAGFKPELAEKMAERSGPALDNMAAWGMKIGSLTPGGGTSNQYQSTRFEMYRSEVPGIPGAARGYDMIEPLVDYLQVYVQENKLAYLLNTQATEITVDASGKVTGVKTVDRSGKEKVFPAKAVILASGGYADNADMIDELTDYVKWTSSSGGQSNGIMIKAAADIGAGTYLMNTTRFDGGVIPMPHHRNGIKVELEMLYQEPGMMWLNKAGNIPSETNRQEMYRRAAENTIYVFFHGNSIPSGGLLTYGNYATGSKDADNSRFKELVEEERVAWKADSVEAVAEKAGLNPAAVRAAFNSFNTGKTPPRNIPAEGPYYIVETIANIKNTTGGLLSNANAEILKPDNLTAIPGLYGAGEVTGPFGSIGNGGFQGANLTLGAAWGDEAAKNALAYTKK